MSQQIEFTSYIPTSLVGNNSPSKTLAAEVVTGLPIPTGALPGNAFFLSESWANQLSTVSINGAPVLKCHAGWYTIVQLQASAVATNVWQGAIGMQQSLANGRSVVTDAATANTAGLQGVNPVVFLNALLAGNYTIVQIGGDASVLVAAGQTISVGTNLVSTNTGLVAAAGAISDAVYETLIGVATAALTTPSALTLSAAAAASGGSQVLTGTITGGGSNAFAGQYAVIAGFDLTANNSAAGTAYLVTASTTTTLTVSNPNGVADTHAATATLQGLVRCNLGFPYGGIK